MVFSDQAFVFFFLPISIALGLLAIRLKFFAPMALFLGLSFFYGSSGLYVLLLVVSITLNYFGGLAVERWHRRSTIALVIAFNLAILVYYKYAGIFYL